MRGWLALLLSFVAAPLASAQARLELFVPADQTPRFGEPFELAVVATRAPGAVFDAGWLAPLQVERVRPAVTLGVGPGADRYEWRCVVRAFAVGEVTVGGDREVTLAPGNVTRATLPPVTLRVASVLPTPPGDYEWPGDVREPRSATWWPLALVGFVLVSVAAAALRRRVPAPPPVPALPPAAPPHQQVLAGFAALGDDLDDLAFHTELAALMRRYLALRYDLHADARTSEELWLHHDRDGALLRDCLWRCDLVKFACIAPPRDERERARQAAIAFVQRTAAPGEAA